MEQINQKKQVDYQRIADGANAIRIDIIREIHASGSGHPGGSLSAADILAALYFHQMNIDPQNPQKEDRDKFVLSKGHAAPVLYGALAERGYFPKEKLTELRKLGSILQGHPDMKKVPGVEMSTGSLGQGFSASVGIAIGNRISENNAKVYFLIGDGEIQEGIVWEAAMSAAHYKLNNLIGILDYNGLQIDGKNDDVMTVRPVDEKFKAFGWNVLVIDGHDHKQIIGAFEEAGKVKDKPTMIIANTVKGKGVSFMENEAGWHGKAPNDEEAKKAVEELGGVW